MKKAKYVELTRFAIMLPTGIFAESSQQGGPMLFSSVPQAESELRQHPRRGAIIIPVTLAYQSVGLPDNT